MTPKHGNHHIMLGQQPISMGSLRFKYPFPTMEVDKGTLLDDGRRPKPDMVPFHIRKKVLD